MSSWLPSWTTYTLPPHSHRVGDVFSSLDEHLWAYSGIRIHGGKTQVWNAVDDRQEFCDVLEQTAQKSDPHARGVARFCTPSRETRHQSLGDTTGPSTVCGGVSVQENCCSRGVAATHSCSALIRNPHGPSCFIALSARANDLLRVDKTRSHEGLLTATQRGLVEVPLQDLARGPRKLRRRESGSVNATESGWHGFAGRTQSGPLQLIGRAGPIACPLIFKRHEHVANLLMHELDGAPVGALGCCRSPSGSDWSV